MTADELIDSYVTEVVQLLPRKQRHDVATELGALLREELSNRDGEAQAYLASFGRPAEVASRYGSPVSLIDPADTRRFLKLAVAGTAVLFIGGLAQVLTQPLETGLLQAIGSWWAASWIQVFWWPLGSGSV